MSNDKPIKCGVVPLSLKNMQLAKPEELHAAILLAMHDIAFFNFGHWEGDDGEVKILLICNDTFGYACADCESISWEQAPEILNIYNDSGERGVIRWIANRRGESAIPPVEKWLNETVGKEGEGVPNGQA